MISELKLQKNLFNCFFLDIKLKSSMKGSDFVFDCDHLLYYKCHKSNPNCGGSYESPY